MYIMHLESELGGCNKEVHGCLTARVITIKRSSTHTSTCSGLRNDHKTVMKLIEEKLHQLHAEAKEKKLLTQQKSGSTSAAEGGGESAPPLRGFATVNVVTDGSPAALAVCLLMNLRGG